MVKICLLVGKSAKVLEPPYFVGKSAELANRPSLCLDLPDNVHDLETGIKG